jgi:hypothetical protein
VLPSLKCPVPRTALPERFIVKVVELPARLTNHKEAANPLAELQLFDSAPTLVTPAELNDSTALEKVSPKESVSLVTYTAELQVVTSTIAAL